MWTVPVCVLHAQPSCQLVHLAEEVLNEGVVVVELETPYPCFIFLLLQTKVVKRLIIFEVIVIVSFTFASLLYFSTKWLYSISLEKVMGGIKENIVLW